MELQSGSHISLMSCTFDGVKHGAMHGNDMQMRLCIIKLGVVSSVYGDFWEESWVKMHVRILFF